VSAPQTEIVGSLSSL
jgi:hypothetical protein